MKSISSTKERNAIKLPGYFQEIWLLIISFSLSLLNSIGLSSWVRVTHDDGSGNEASVFPGEEHHLRHTFLWCRIRQWKKKKTSDHSHVKEGLLLCSRATQIRHDSQDSFSQEMLSFSPSLVWSFHSLSSRLSSLSRVVSSRPVFNLLSVTSHLLGLFSYSLCWVECASLLLVCRSFCHMFRVLYILTCIHILNSWSNLFLSP